MENRRRQRAPSDRLKWPLLGWKAKGNCGKAGWLQKGVLLRVKGETGAVTSLHS